MNLNELREQVRLMTLGIIRKRAGFAAGAIPSPSIALRLEHGREWLTSDYLQLVREARSGTDGRRELRLRMLETHLADLIALVPCADLLDEFASRSIDGAIAIASVGREAERESRAEKERTAVGTLSTFNDSLARAWDLRRAAIAKCGVSSFADLWSEKHGWPAASLALEAQSFLAETESMYLEVFDWWLRRSTGQRLFPDGAQRHDLLRALALPPFDGLFPSGPAIKSLSDEFGGSEIDDSGVLVRPTVETTLPNPRAWPVDAPRSVDVVFRAESGFASTRDFLRAWGEAVHYANADPDSPFEDRLLGGDSLPRGIGTLFQNVLLERHFVARAFGTDPSDLRRLMALAELARLRHAAAVFLHTLDVDRDGWTARSAEAFAERVSHATGVAWPSGLARLECGFDFDSAVTLIAAAFEATLLPAIRDACDEDWWRNPRTGPYLARISKPGQLFSVKTVAKSAGAAEPSLGAVARRIQSVLG